PPPSPSDRTHVYYQYCAYVAARDAVVRRGLRRGLDVEFHHMDVCPDLPLFAGLPAESAGARRTCDAVQLPIHVDLGRAGVDAVGRRFRDAVLGPGHWSEARAGVE